MRFTFDLEFDVLQGYLELVVNNLLECFFESCKVVSESYKWLPIKQSEHSRTFLAWYEEKNQKTRNIFLYRVESENPSHDCVRWRWGRGHYLHLVNKECTRMEGTRILRSLVMVILCRLGMLVGECCHSPGPSHINRNVNSLKQNSPSGNPLLSDAGCMYLL